MRSYTLAPSAYALGKAHQITLSSRLGELSHSRRDPALNPTKQIHTWFGGLGIRQRSSSTLLYARPWFAGSRALLAR